MKLREEKCVCGWRWVGFHICVDLSVPDVRVVSEKFRRAYGISETHLEALADGRAKRWADHHANNAERDSAMAKYYAEGHSMKEVAEKFDMARSTAIRIINKAADKGLVTIRPRGYNLKYTNPELDREPADA